MEKTKKYGRGHGGSWQYQGVKYPSASALIRDNDLDISLQLFGYRRRLLQSRGIENPTAEQIINYQRRPLKPAKRSLGSSDGLSDNYSNDYIKELETALVSLKPDYMKYTTSYELFFQDIPYKLQLRELTSIISDFKHTQKQETYQLIERLIQRLKKPMSDEIKIAIKNAKLI